MSCLLERFRKLKIAGKKRSRGKAYENLLAYGKNFLSAYELRKVLVKWSPPKVSVKSSSKTKCNFRLLFASFTRYFPLGFWDNPRHLSHLKNLVDNGISKVRHWAFGILKPTNPGNGFNNTTDSGFEFLWHNGRSFFILKLRTYTAGLIKFFFSMSFWPIIYKLLLINLFLIPIWNLEFRLQSMQTGAKTTYGDVIYKIE